MHQVSQTLKPGDLDELSPGARFPGGHRAGRRLCGRADAESALLQCAPNRWRAGGNAGRLSARYPGGAGAAHARQPLRDSRRRGARPRGIPLSTERQGSGTRSRSLRAERLRWAGAGAAAGVRRAGEAPVDGRKRFHRPGRAAGAVAARAQRFDAQSRRAGDLLRPTDAHLRPFGQRQDDHRPPAGPSPDGLHRRAIRA